ncbi:MAG: sulfatase [Sphingobacteriales bacterium]|nr:sulfatase [Sphingobacteriales bacterium]
MLLILFIICFGVAGFTTSAFAQSKPNIIMYIADDLNQQDVGCYGNNEVSTPNIDLLAKQGMRFTNAYAASPMCSPSRAALFTGLYPFRNGTQMNHFAVKAKTLSLPHYMKEQGYRVVISGKIHVAPEETFPFERIGEDFGKYEPIENRLDRKRETVNFIKQHFRENSKQPVCLFIAPWVPHVPWFPYKDFDPDKLTIPDYLVDTRQTRQALASYYQSIKEGDNFFGEIMKAIQKEGKGQETMTVFISDQGAQFPSAKWTVYDKGIRVPLIVKWPEKIRGGTVSKALVSLVDILPTFIDIAGGKKVQNLDGSSLKNIFLEKTKDHHDYIFAETSVEPHFWYNYTPARSIVTKEGLHYIKNYHSGLRFITHIDKVERNEFYFDSWIAKSGDDNHAAFLTNRYSYRPPEELFDIQNDKNEFSNLAGNSIYYQQLLKLRKILNSELKRQGETDDMILLGPLPKWGDMNYVIRQNTSVSHLSFNKQVWNPDTLFITAFISGLENGGIICDYFNNFKLFGNKNHLGIVTFDGQVFQSQKLTQMDGHLIFKLSSSGLLHIEFNGLNILETKVDEDLTKIKNGYVTCGQLQGREEKGKLQSFKGKIFDLQFSMNNLLRNP